MNSNITFNSGKNLSPKDLLFSIEYARNYYASQEGQPFASPVLLSFLYNIIQVLEDTTSVPPSSKSAESSLTTWKLVFRYPQSEIEAPLRRLCLLDSSITPATISIIGTGTFLASLGLYEVAHFEKPNKIMLTGGGSNLASPDDYPKNISVTHYPTTEDELLALDALDIGLVLFPTAKLIKKTETLPDVSAYPFTTTWGDSDTDITVLYYPWPAESDDPILLDQVITKTIEPTPRLWLATLKKLRFFKGVGASPLRSH